MIVLEDSENGLSRKVKIGMTKFQEGKVYRLVWTGPFLRKKGRFAQYLGEKS